MRRIPNTFRWATLLCTTPILAIILSPLGCSKKQPESKEITIGAILPLTGDDGVYGRAIQKGINLAIEEIQKRKSITCKIIYEDDQGKPTSSVSSVNKLINVDNVSVIIGGAMGSTAEPIIPITEKNKVVLVSPTATKPSLTDNTNYFFRLWPSDNYDGKVMAEIAYQGLRMRRIAVLYVDVSYGQGIAEVFKSEFISAGGEIVAYEPYPKNSTDFRTQIERIRPTKPDAVYIPGYVNEISNLLKQAKELDFTPRFLGVNSLYNPKLIEIAGNAAEGAIFTYPTYDQESMQPSIANFINSFKEKYGEIPDVFSAQGYDSFQVIVQAIELGQGVSAGKIRKGLHLINEYIGPGGRIHFESTGDVEKPLRLLTIKKGCFVPYE